MAKPKHLTEKLAQLKVISYELNKILADGSFYELPFFRRYAWIRKIKKLYGALLGPISGSALRHVLAAAAIVVLGAGCGTGGGGGGPSFVDHSFDIFGIFDFGENAHPTFVDINNDGAIDAFIGNKAGETRYFENTEY